MSGMNLIFRPAAVLLLSTIATPAFSSEANNVMHAATRDPDFAEMVMNLDTIDALSENQKQTMDESFRAQFQSQGYNVKYVPEVSYQTSIIEKGNGQAVGLSVFTNEWQRDGQVIDTQNMLFLMGFVGDTFHKVVCYGVINPYHDEGCLAKAEEIFGRLAPTK